MLSSESDTDHYGWCSGMELNAESEDEVEDLEQFYRIQQRYQYDHRYAAPRRRWYQYKQPATYRRHMLKRKRGEEGRMLKRKRGEEGRMLNRKRGEEGRAVGTQPCPFAQVPTKRALLPYIDTMATKCTISKDALAVATLAHHCLGLAGLCGLWTGYDNVRTRVSEEERVVNTVNGEDIMVQSSKVDPAFGTLMVIHCRNEAEPHACSDKPDIQTAMLYSGCRFGIVMTQAESVVYKADWGSTPQRCGHYTNSFQWKQLAHWMWQVRQTFEAELQTALSRFS